MSDETPKTTPRDDERRTHQSEQPIEREDDDSIWKSSKQASQIGRLIEVEKQIATLLELAGQTVASLSSDTGQGRGDAQERGGGQRDGTGMEVDEDDENSGDVEGTGEDFQACVKNYYSTLNAIQLSLRKSVHTFRVSKASPRVLLFPPPQLLSSSTSVAPGGVSFSDLRSASQPQGGEEGDRDKKEATTTGSELSTAALRMELEAWTDLRDSLKALNLDTREKGNDIG